MLLVDYRSIQLTRINKYELTRIKCHQDINIKKFIMVAAG